MDVINTVKLLMRALGDTLPEGGCRHFGPEELAHCTRCQALRVGRAFLNEQHETVVQSAPITLEDNETVGCEVAGCHEPATFIELRDMRMHYYCDADGKAHGLLRGIPTDMMNTAEPASRCSGCGAPLENGHMCVGCGAAN